MVWLASFPPLIQKSPEKVFYLCEYIGRIHSYINVDIQNTQGNCSVKSGFGRCLATSLMCPSSLSQRKKRSELPA